MLIIKIVRKGTISHLAHKGIFQEKNVKPGTVFLKIFLLEKATIELVAIQKQMMKLTEEFEEKYLRK
jgi:hypothetical protein